MSIDSDNYASEDPEDSPYNQEIGEIVKGTLSVWEKEQELNQAIEDFKKKEAEEKNKKNVGELEYVNHNQIPQPEDKRFYTAPRPISDMRNIPEAQATVSMALQVFRRNGSFGGVDFTNINFNQHEIKGISVTFHTAKGPVTLNLPPQAIELLFPGGRA